MREIVIIIKKNDIAKVTGHFLTSDRHFRALPQSLEEFLEQCIAENLLDSVDQGKMAKLMTLLHRMESSLAATMKKKGVATSPLPTMEAVEAEAIRAALDYYRGNVTKAAKALGIGRNTLYRKMKENEREVEPAINQSLAGRTIEMRKILIKKQDLREACKEVNGLSGSDRQKHEGEVIKKGEALLDN